MAECSDDELPPSLHEIEEETIPTKYPHLKKQQKQGIYDNQLRYLCGGRFISKPIFLNNGQLFAIAQSTNVKVYSAQTGQFVANLPHEKVLTVLAHPDNAKQVIILSFSRHQQMDDDSIVCFV